MEQSKTRLTEQLLETIEDLPAERVAEIIDFADYIRGKYGQPRQHRRGSPEAILRDLEEHGPLIFGPGELDAILAEIEEARGLDRMEPLDLDQTPHG